MAVAGVIALEEALIVVGEAAEAITGNPELLDGYQPFQFSRGVYGSALAADAVGIGVGTAAALSHFVKRNADGGKFIYYNE
jgi:hypothetical protein